MWHVYVLYSKLDNKFYIGLTNNLKRRLKEHKLGKTQTTKHLRQWKLVYCEISINKQDTINREKQLKTGFGRSYLQIKICYPDNCLTDMVAVAQWLEH